MNRRKLVAIVKCIKFWFLVRVLDKLEVTESAISIEMEKENRELRKNGRTFAKKEFPTKVFFPKIMESTKKKFEAVRKWIETNYPDFVLNSLQDAEHHFNYFFSRHGFYKAFSEGVLKENKDFTIVERRGRLMAVVEEAKHPFISTIQEEIMSLSCKFR